MSGEIQSKCEACGSEYQVFMEQTPVYANHVFTAMLLTECPKCRKALIGWRYVIAALPLYAIQRAMSFLRRKP